jgi:hypothetical protein
MSTLKSVKVQMRETSLPKKGAEEFWGGREGGEGLCAREFDEPFKKPPTVGVALKRFDLGNRMANIPHRG